MSSADTTLRENLQRSLGAAYTLDHELGGGGMARVFVADENALGRRVVVKIAPVEVLSAASIDRFKREIAVSARLHHPHIVPLLSAGEMDGLPFYTMPFVEGETLRARISRTGQLPVDDTVRILRQLASALAFAHSKGVVHRDIKPENILLSSDHALVADFGVAKALSVATHGDSGLTTAGIAVGTPAYMAPEQAAADPSTDHRADIYAVGVVAYEMLAGRPPFVGRNAQALIAAHIIETPEPIGRKRSGLDSTLATLVMRCLAKKPSERPQSADELLRRLEAIRPTSGTEHDEKPSLAVLPLANLSGDPDDEHFSDGLTDELIGALSQLAELTVSGRTSVFALKGKSLDTRAITEMLGVANVLEGSVRRSGARLKVRVQLVDADAKVVWSAAYDRLMTDVFEVQEEIAQAVVHALEIRFGAARQLVRASTDDVTAYDLYLRGRFAQRRLHPGDVERSIDYFNQAIAHDPSFARAYAGLSFSEALLAVFTDRRGIEVLPLARAHALKALELDDSLADAHLGMAHAAVALEWDTTAGARGYERALALDPGHPESRHMYAIMLLGQRRYDESEAQLLQTLATDPLYAAASMTLGQLYLATGQTDRAVERLQAALELSPDFMYAREQLAHAYIQLGRYDDAVTEYKRIAEMGGTREAATYAYILATAGRTSEAQARVQRLLESESSYVPPTHLAMAYAALQDTDRAMRMLERAYDERDPHLYSVNGFNPAFVRMRTEPRFVALVRKMGLA
jgi:serine/threonine-protein kinase